MGPRALLFDFNGTLSDDEPILCEIFGELFAELDRPLTAETYFERLAGLADPEIARTWLGADHPAVERVVAAKIARYRIRVADGSSVPDHVREAVREAAAAVTVGVVSGSARAEIEPVLAASGLNEFVETIVSIDDVDRGKPDPAGYLRALEALEIAAKDAIALEDTDVGIDAARAAGLRCIAVLGTLPSYRLARADEIVPRLDAALVRRLCRGR
jgi:HAD superfamily hydrolase (TIGR01509 family)